MECAILHKFNIVFNVTDHASLIDAFTGKVLDFDLRSKICEVCQYHFVEMKLFQITSVANIGQVSIFKNILCGVCTCIGRNIKKFFLLKFNVCGCNVQLSCFNVLPCHSIYMHFVTTSIRYFKSKRLL